MNIKKYLIYFVLFATILATLPLGAGNFSVPKAQAAEISSDTYIGPNDTTRDGSDLLISTGATVTMDGTHNFSSLEIKDNGTTLTHSNVDRDGNIVFGSDYYAVHWTGYVYLSNSYGGIVHGFNLLPVGGKAFMKIEEVSTGIKWENSDWYSNTSADKQVKPTNCPVSICNGSKGMYYVDLQYKKNSGENGGAHLSKLSQGDIPSSDLFLNADKSQGTCGTLTGINGLCGEYFNYTELTKDDLITSYGPPRATRLDPTIKFNWGESAPISLTDPGGLTLNIENDLTINSGGMIDVSGKGYPGGQKDKQDGSGPSGSVGKHAYVSGSASRRVLSGGGGSYGDGGTPTQASSGGLPEDKWRTGAGGAGTGGEDTIDFGSGGGNAHGVDDGGGWCGSAVSNAWGGNGGGKIELDVKGTITVEDDSSIKADGANGNYDYDHKGGTCSGVETWSWSGAGGGGTISIKAGTFDIGVKNTDIFENIGSGVAWVHGHTQDGKISGTEKDLISNVITAKGGDAALLHWTSSWFGQTAVWENAENSGGGGRIILGLGAGGPSRQPGKRITVEVTYPENGATKTYYLKSILQDLKDYR